MVCELLKTDIKLRFNVVLILVLMEDGLRAATIKPIAYEDLIVLILVLMEDGLRVGDGKMMSTSFYAVLILVLMEDGLRAVSETLIMKLCIKS